METNNQITSQINTSIKETRKCIKCGRILPISKFERFGNHGWHKKCKDCENETYSTDKRFEGISARDLILELRARGYKGKLQKITIEDVVI